MVRLVRRGHEATCEILNLVINYNTESIEYWFILVYSMCTALLQVTELKSVYYCVCILTCLSSAICHGDAAGCESLPEGQL